jgi:hypothetical protein
MKALYICENLMNYITREKIIQGRVHSVFNNACNIETEHDFITLLSKDKYMAPMSVVVDISGEVNFIKFSITPNLNFFFNVNGILCTERNIIIELNDVKRWHPGAFIRPSPLSEEDVLDNVKIVEDTLNLYGKLNGLGPLINMLGSEIKDLKLGAFKTCNYDKRYEFIYDRFTRFIHVAAERDVKNIADAAKKVIGFGPGLTPSMDDFISGLMVSLIYLGSFYKLDTSQIYNFNKELISKGINKTTKVSSEMLKHSCVGETNEAVRELMQVLLHEIDREKIIMALIKTINFGETSGSDTALGIYVGCKILTNLNYRREWLNEVMH